MACMALSGVDVYAGGGKPKGFHATLSFFFGIGMRLSPVYLSLSHVMRLSYLTYCWLLFLPRTGKTTTSYQLPANPTIPPSYSVLCSHLFLYLDEMESTPPHPILTSTWTEDHSHLPESRLPSFHFHYHHFLFIGIEWTALGWTCWSRRHVESDRRKKGLWLAFPRERILLDSSSFPISFDLSQLNLSLLFTLSLSLSLSLFVCEWVREGLWTSIGLSPRGTRVKVKLNTKTHWNWNCNV